MQIKRKIIFGFAGRKRSGKGVLADYVVEKFGGVKITIASYLKKLCADLLGMSTEEMNSKKDDGTVLNIPFKDEWCQKIADATEIDLDEIRKICDGVVIKDVRHLLQFVGTDVIRRFVPTWHSDQAVKDIQRSEKEVFAVDDVRFPDELKALRELGAIVFYIMRPFHTEVSNHSSETSLMPYDFNRRCVLINQTTTPEEFVRLFSKVAKFCVNTIHSYQYSNVDYSYEDVVSALNKTTFSELTEGRLFGKEEYDEPTMKALIEAIKDGSSEYRTLFSEIGGQMKDRWHGEFVWYHLNRLYSQEEHKVLHGLSPMYRHASLGNKAIYITKPLYIELLKFFVV